MKKSFIRRAFLTTLMLLAFVPIWAQGQVKVTGVVTGPDGEPLIGASVIQKGTTNGVMTDLDGNYELLAPAGTELEISYIGYVTKSITAMAGKFDVTLEVDNQFIEESIVVGYGVQKKRDVTGAISQVKSEDLQARTISNASQALQGKTAGVQVLSSSARPGASPTIRIRGISSNGSCDPLYVVDGRIATDISGIDPNDIQSMEVLKDGASAAIYGAQAGNGVILITTRKGSGDGKITYDYQLTSQSLAIIPKVMNAEQYADYYMEAGTFDIDRLYRYWDQKTNTDWARETFENSLMQRHNLTFSAGNERSSLYTSISYLNNNGIVAGDADVYSRITGMLNASWKIKQWLEIGTNNQLEYYKARSVAEGNEYGSLLLSVLQLDPLSPTHYAEEDLPDYMRALMDKSIYGELLKDKDGRYYAIPAFGAAESSNPFIMRDNAYSMSRGFNINGSTYLNFTPVKGLMVTSRFGYRLSGGESYGYTNDYYSNANAHQNFMSVNASTSTPTYWQWENFANYNHQFKGGHNFNAMAGMSFSESRSFGVSGSISGSDGEFGFKQDDPLFYYFAYATAGETKSVSGGEERFTRKYSWFGRLNYDFRGKYMLQLSLRADAADSSVLPTSNRWGYFPAVSAGWTVTEEEFMSGARNWLNNLKIRASWGQNGSTASLGGYSWKNSIASTGSYPINDNPTYIPGYGPSSTGNESLKWETSEQLNVGFDARF
ncbi:MAG: SusC/RagA family TonB-linked outer membrane protein, partial [Bacteroidales bacterium]|nr:SusC/RagA family TonB-linked outer membrane protein [Bacteroidales bacterium]